jgi:hypothetical protein
MVVTLEVSKLSGWLKADAYCRVGGRACDAGGRGASREAGEPGVWWRHTNGMHGDGPTQGFGAKGTRGAHPKHVAHGRDAGGVEAQRLVEGPRVLPSRREGMRCGGETPSATHPLRSVETSLEPMSYVGLRLRIGVLNCEGSSDVFL